MNTARTKESAEKSFAPVPLQARTTLNLGSADGGIYFGYPEFLVDKMPKM